MKKDLSAIIKKINKLKPMSQVAQKVISIAEDPDSSITELSEIIAYDQALTANLLKMCNSAHFGLPREVESVQQSILYLGLDQIIDMVLMSGWSSHLKGRQHGYDLDRGELWRYSVASALIARELAEMKKVEKKHLIFTSALIKDIGKIVLGQFVEDSYEKIRFLVSEHAFSFREAEKAVIGIDHAELGALVAEKWNFSTKMRDIIRFHHSPSEAEDAQVETGIVHIADVLCMMMGIGVGADGLSYRLDNAVIERLGFSERDLQGTIAGFGEKLEKVEALIGAS